MDNRMKYHIDLTKVANHLISWYNENKHLADSVTLDNGRKIDFSKKSITRIALKTALVPIAIPTLKMLYAMKGAELPAHEKHADLIDYVVVQMISFLALLDQDSLYVETTEGVANNERYIHAITPNAPIPIGSRTIERAEKTEEKTERSGGETYIRSREDRDGENETYQRDSS